MNTGKYMNLFSVDCDSKYSSEATRKTYKYCVAKFLAYFSYYERPKDIPNHKIKKWLLSFDTVNTRKQMLCSINAFYKLTMGMPKKIKRIPYPKKEKKLPRVIDNGLLKMKLAAIENIKHKCIISLAYATGLRVSEVVNLKMEHIDSKRMLIHVVNGKGKKDRVVPFSEDLLNLMRTYYLEYKPQVYLFNGSNGMRYSASSCNCIVKKYIGDEYHFHLLRHSCFTYMLEHDTDISVIQKIAGHSSIKTTLIYSHISNNLLKAASAPI